jgi:hypothetical protein
MGSGRLMFQNHQDEVPEGVCNVCFTHKAIPI